MTDFTADNVPFERPRRHWAEAFKALQKLLSDKEDTGQVFKIMAALSGDAIGEGYRRLLRTPRGGHLAMQHVELEPLLMDDAWLDSFAEGSVGAAYREYIRSQHFSAKGLGDLSRAQNNGVELDHPHAWFARRIRDSHDIWHTLTGYHRDALGEACLVAFSFAQTKSLGWAFIALGAALRTRGSPHKHPYMRAIWEGYQRGRKAAWLCAEDYEQLMAEPLEAARRRLKLTPPAIYDAIPPEHRNPVGA